VTNEELFLAARTAVDRTALERYKKAEGVDEDDEVQKRAAVARFRQLPLLLIPPLRDYAYSVAEKSRGIKINGDTKFLATLWIYGATHIKNGYRFDRSLNDFIQLLHERAREVAPKGQGWVIEPTTTLNGHRTNASTVAMHALFLDCDSSGEWDKTVSTLHALDLAFVAYQSGGYQPSIPKWRIVLPLSTPFDTSSEELRAVWKNVYHHARVVFGALGELLGEGFDPRTDTPAIPWFLTEKREVGDTPRQIISCTDGHALDLMAMVMALPTIEDVQPTVHTHRGEIKSTGLSDEKLDELISELSRVTNAVPSGRHDLYLAIPGVLLDRGVPPDEVIAIIEGVSASYPRKHPDKHRDNVHNARTTVSKWEAGAPVTRIGTLNERWPAIAQVLDRLIPDPFTAQMIATTQWDSTTVATPSMPDAPVAPIRKKKPKLTPLGKEIKSLIPQMEKSINPLRRLGAVLVTRILAGESFESAQSTPEQVDQLVNTAVGTLGFNLPETTWAEILDLAKHTLLTMNFTQSVARVKAAELAFLKGQRKRRKWNAKQDAKTQQERAEAQSFFEEAARIRNAQ